MFFSIVIPTYNRAAYVLKTIETILAQTYQDFELIVVDDGSSDNTGEILKNITDSRFQYHKKANGERGAARNYGAGLSKGRYVNFFDSDDLAYPNHLQTAYDHLIKLGSPEVIHLAYGIRTPEGDLIRNANQFPSTINRNLINGNHLSCNGVFIRRDVTAQFPFSENRALSASEDYALWLKLASRYPIHCVNEITTSVINHDARSVLTIKKDSFLKRIELLKQEVLSDGHFAKVYREETKKFQAYLNVYVALHLGMARYPRSESLPYLLKAMQLDPTVILKYRFLAALKNILL